MEIAQVILEKIGEKEKSLEIYEDCFSAIKNLHTRNDKKAFELSKKLKDKVKGAIEIVNNGYDFFELYKNILLFESPYLFDSYLQYLEINRKPSQRVYLPRRRVLKQFVDAMQDLTDGNLDELFMSCPPRIGKSTLLMFYVTWLIGRDSEKSNLYCAYSDIITSAFYNGVSEVINDPVTYTWSKVFPKCQIASTNAKEETLNIDRKKRYPSLTCRSLYGTLNGACDCGGVLISDDLISGIEEAMNKDRLIGAWSKVDNNLLTRAKESAKVLWCGTRWSIADPIGKREDLLVNDDRFKGRRYKVINIPALNEEDETNFDYKYDVGFSTDYYRQKRASFERNNDMASWNAQYMQEPIEREGTLFAPEDLRYYNGELPPMEECERIFMAVDPAFGGGDFVASPICYRFNNGNDIFVHDVVYSDLDKSKTQPMLAKAILEHNVNAVRIEATRATEAYKEGVEKILKEKDYKCNMTTKSAPTNVSKIQRIYDKAPDIRERLIFRESGKRSKDYELFMQNVLSFKLVGKNKHDDAPDSLAMAIDMDISPNRKVEVFARPF